MPRIADRGAVEDKQRNDKQYVEPKVVNYDPCWNAVVDSSDINDEFCTDHQTEGDGRILGKNREVGPVRMGGGREEGRE